MKGDFFIMTKTKKKAAPLWVVLSRGGLVSLGVYFGGLLGLSALVVNGRVGEGSVFAWAVGLCCVASFAGALTTTGGTPWSPPAAGAITAAVFVGAIAIAGLALDGSLVPGHGGLLAAGAMLGGFCAGVVRRKRRGKRTRR